MIHNSIEALSGSEQMKQLVITSWEDHSHGYISIADNGPGIPADIQATIFHPFVSSKQNGTGLGLAICQQIMERNSAELQFTSQPGETVFTCRFVKRGAAPESSGA